MALTNEHRQFIKMAAKEAAQQAVAEANGNLRMMAREEAVPIAKQAVADCPQPARAKAAFWKRLFYMLLAATTGGLVSQLINITKIIRAINGQP